MHEDSLIEIDEPSDWLIIEQLLQTRLSKNKSAGSAVKALVLDVDGVFTDGKVATAGNGELTKSFSLRDGMGLEIARENNLEIIVITSENSPIVDQRIGKLNISHYYKNVKDKYALLTHLSQKLGISRTEMAYIGDDVNDLANMLSAGWSMAPKNAVDEVKYKADLILHSDGGDKAIREGIEFILRFNKRLKHNNNE